MVRCGFPKESTTSLVRPLSTVNASKFDVWLVLAPEVGVYGLVLFKVVSFATASSVIR